MILMILINNKYTIRGVKNEALCTALEYIVYFIVYIYSLYVIKTAFVQTHTLYSPRFKMILENGHQLFIG